MIFINANALFFHCKHSLMGALSSSGTEILMPPTQAEASRCVCGGCRCLSLCGYVCGCSQTSHTPGWLAVSLLTTKATYINLGSLAIGQKLGDDVGPGTHQETKLLVKLKSSLESLIFLSSHLGMQHFKITLSVNFVPSWARIKHSLHMQKWDPSICVRPLYHNPSRTGSPGFFMQWSGL